MPSANSPAGIGARLVSRTPDTNRTTNNFSIQKIDSMPRYYVNKNAQSNGDHEVHRQDCSFLPDEENRIYLGDFTNCRDAVRKAREYYRQVDGCYYCSPACHTQ